jgi:hypothetical protein
MIAAPADPQARNQLSIVVEAARHSAVFYIAATP